MSSREKDDRSVVVWVALIRNYRRGCLAANQLGDLAHIFARKTPKRLLPVCHNLSVGWPEQYSVRMGSCSRSNETEISNGRVSRQTR
jgi:hypothetical protein